MSKLDLLRQQHDSALAMAQRLLELIEAYRPGGPGYPILIQLNRLYGLLRVHLALEDIQLYPALMSSGDRSVARTARRYVDEMGGLAAEMESFARHWSCSASITGNFAEFREAAHDLVLALAVRIERETQQLYPLVEVAMESRADAA